MKSIKELFLIVFLALLVRIPWLLLVPHVEAPDENTHFWVVQFIANNLRLPDYQSIIKTGYVAVYGSIPQLGYLPHIFFLKCFSSFIAANKALYVARIGSMLMGLVVVSVSYYMGKLLFVDKRLASLALPILIAFHPQFVFVTAYVNNDSTTAALAAIILLILFYALKSGLNKVNTICLAICCSLLILSKYSGYCILVTTFITLLIVLYKHKEKLKEQLTLLGGMAFAILLLTSWWFIRNYWRFAGDITGVKTMHSIWTLTYHRYVEKFSSPLGVLFSSRFWRMLFFSFWGWFGYMTRELPRSIYYSYLGFVIVSCLGFMRSNIKQLSSPWFVLSSCLIINLLVCIFGMYSGVAGPQGRYLFSSEIPIMALLIGGLNLLPGKWSKYLIVSLIAFNIFAYFYSSLYLFKLYN